MQVEQVLPALFWRSFSKDVCPSRSADGGLCKAHGSYKNFTPVLDNPRHASSEGTLQVGHGRGEERHPLQTPVHWSFKTVARSPCTMNLLGNPQPPSVPPVTVYCTVQHVANILFVRHPWAKFQPQNAIGTRLHPHNDSLKPTKT